MRGVNEWRQNQVQILDLEASIICDLGQVLNSTRSSVFL